MHIPDGFIGLPTALGGAVAATGGVGASLRIAQRTLREHQVPLAGLSAAFLFVAQMINVPVAAGTSGHLIGGAVVSVLLGPALGVIVLTVVVAVQALAFSDGGISALGLNVLNLAIVTVLVGWLVFRALTALLPKTGASVVVATAVASWASVVAASASFAGEYALGGVGGVAPSTVFGAMVGVHSLIGVFEGLAGAALVAAVLATRPDLVWGARLLGVRHTEAVAMRRKPVLVFATIGTAVTAFLLIVVAPHASTAPDGLERVADDTGIGAEE